jgi:hypothetical protein
MKLHFTKKISVCMYVCREEFFLFLFLFFADSQRRVFFISFSLLLSHSFASEFFLHDLFTHALFSTRPIHSRSSPCSRSSLSHTHRFMGFFHNQNGLLTAPALQPLVFLSACDNEEREHGDEREWIGRVETTVSVSFVSTFEDRNKGEPRNIAHRNTNVNSVTTWASL